MSKITSHPILDIPVEDLVEFDFEGHKVQGQRGHTIAAALHQAGYPVHKHSLKGRNRTLECGIGKCGACEMLVDGAVRRICITNVDGVKHVERIGDANESGKIKTVLDVEIPASKDGRTVYKTAVAIIGAGPAGLACREELRKAGVDCLVIDNNSSIGGQFNMQTHQFFFFEKERRFGGMRGFDIAKTLAGDSQEGILLDSVVWDILEGKRLAVKNIKTREVFYIDADSLVVATGAVPFMPAFKNDDVPGVYTAAVVQRMMNREFTLLGKNVLTVGAGNIGYLTSYQLMQAGAHVKAIIEAMPNEGGFPVQANRVRRLGIPIMTSHVLLEAVPNANRDGITGAIIAECENFKPIAGTERLLDGIDCINICTGLLPDKQLFTKGSIVFGRDCYGVGDSVRIGEGTSAVLRGRQCALEILQDAGRRIDYNEYLTVSKDYIDSQQKPIRVLQEPRIPEPQRRNDKGFVITDCLYGFACNPCSFACKQGAITKSSTSVTPIVDYDKCIGCMDCVNQCPGLAIFGYRYSQKKVYLPVEYSVTAGAEVFLVDDDGAKVGSGIIEKVMPKPNKTNVAVVECKDLEGDDLLKVRGLIVKENYPAPLDLKPATIDDAKMYICHCEDVTVERALELIGNRKSITAMELKHITRMGMGDCRGTRCLPRAKQVLKAHGIEVIGEFTPRGPMANQVGLGDLVNRPDTETYVTSPRFTVDVPEKVGAIIAGGGMAGSSLFRYFAEAGFKPILFNKDPGSSWRCIAGGRPSFSVPALAEIARGNLEIFRELQKISNIDMKMTRYVTFSHDQATYKSLEDSLAFTDGYMVPRKDFQKEVSPYFNPDLDIYTDALISKECWQATPGKTIDLVRNIAVEHGGTLMENTELVDVMHEGKGFKVVVRLGDGSYKTYHTDIFVNALGISAGKFAKRLGIETGLYPVKHQAFITKRLPMMGKDGDSLDMLIDRRLYKGFSAVYGQQLHETGQIIACASPANEALQVGRNLKYNTQEFLQLVSEVFCGWIPQLGGVGFQAIWAGYYTEPRYIVDPSLGLMVGMRGHGFMFSQYIAKMYVDAVLGKPVPDYFKRLSITGDALEEKAFA
jgi:glycine/D-amino acid oxidase-like deaminating enzyme/Fe-S-cluster-containing hydrogenase component 2/bacterioferritin-associated ferredoxin